MEKVNQGAVALRSKYDVQVSVVRLDLASLQSVRSAAAEIRKCLPEERSPGLDALVCNAGAQFQGPVSYSKEGYEETFATNQLGNFLLVNLLLDCVTPNGRVVFTASGTHDPEKMDGKMVGKAAEPDAFMLANQGKDGQKAISGGKRYATSKLCTILFAYELDRRLKTAHQHISSIAFDPGFIPETGLSRTAPAFMRWLLRTRLLKWFVGKLGVSMGSLPFSGEALARVAVDSEFAGATGQFIQVSSGTVESAQSSKVSYDQQKARNLWEDSTSLVSLQATEHPQVLR